MKTTNIHEKTKLDILGENTRNHFLSAYAEELKHVPSAILVKASYIPWIQTILGSSPYIFISVNFTSADIRKALAIATRKNGGILPANYIPYGQEYCESIRSGTTIQVATEALLRKLLIRLNQKALGAKFKRYGQSLICVGVHENETKKYSAEPTSHFHLLVQVPTTHLSPEYNEWKFKNTFRDLFFHSRMPNSIRF